jgi:hypothetical protein
MPVIDDAIGGAGAGAAFGPIGAIAGGLLGIGAGLFQTHKANKWLKNNPYPTEQLPSEVTENQNIARRNAARGLPSEQYAKAMQDIQRQQLSAIRSSNDRRGGLGMIPAITQGTNDATLNLNARDAAMQLDNEKTLMGENRYAAGWKDKLFQENVKDKYNRDYDYNMGVKGAGNQNMFGGADKVLSGLLGGAYTGGNGLFAGGSGRRKGSSSGSPTYYNGYDENSNYGDFS